MREVSRHLFIPRRPLIASMLSSDPERSWFRIAKASVIMAARFSLTSARVEVQAFQFADDRFGEAAERPLLELVGDCAHQEITGQPHGRRRPMQPPPLAAQFEDRRGGKPCSDSTISIDDLAMSATATRLDAVTAVVACRFRKSLRIC